MAASVIALLFWLVAVPFCIGMIPANFISPGKRTPGFVLLSGYFGMWALFEVAAVPAVLWVEYDNFKVASAAFTVLSLLSAMAGVVLLYRSGKAGKDFFDRPERGAKGISDIDVTSVTDVSSSHSMKAYALACVKKLSAAGIEWLLFFILLGFQLYKAMAFSSFDGDDAYYVVESLIAQEANVMYRILPLKGGSTGLDVRHAMAVFPMWVAFVSVRAGLHATIVSHVVMPLVLIPLTYLLYYEIGLRLFDRGGMEETASGRDAVSKSLSHRENLPVFMCIMALFQIFGNVSIYTNETFFLTRTWQGKAVAGSLVIPAMIWAFLQIYDSNVGKKRTDAGVWILLVCINMTAGVCSSIAVFLVSILAALTAFALAVTQRDWKLLFQAGAACIPNAVYVAVYLIVAYGNIL